MFNLENIIRKNVLNMSPYSSARDEFTGQEAIFLDANENPFGLYNRYPDPYQKALKFRLAQWRRVSPEQIFVGNGSDEIIDLLFRMCCEPGLDKALAFRPSYGMYKVSAEINNVELVELRLTENFQLDLTEISGLLDDDHLKMIIVCSPNNPTGNLMRVSDLEIILKAFRGIVLIDEAYIDFAESTSWVERLDEFPNLVVCQTMSKAFGLAAARIGISYMNHTLVNLMNKIKPPYNVSALNQKAALDAMYNLQQTEEEVRLIRTERKRLKKDLSKLAVVEHIYPSDANFLLVKVSDANLVYAYLVERGVVVRNRNSVIESCIRITVGSTDENDRLIEVLSAYREPMSLESTIKETINTPKND